LVSSIFVEKGWGYEKWITNTEKYCGKILYFNLGKKCSWHYHEIKDEVFYVQSGKIELKYGFSDDLDSASTIVLSAGESFHIPPKMRHQMKGLVDSELFEISTQHFDSDSYRIDKGD
jgi:mannose-6-phosphate isomerase-like protein (cupin superfamily)